MRGSVRFYLPLALYQTLLGIASFPLTVAMSRSQSGSIALAAYGVALSLLAVMTPALVGLSQLALVFGLGSRNRSVILTAAGILTAAAFLVQLAVAYTPLGHAVIAGVLGIDGQLYQPALHAYRILLWFMLPMVIRDLGQAVLLIRGQTRPVAAGMVARTLAVTVWALACTRYSLVSGAAVGAYGTVLGISLEMVLTWIAVNRTRSSPPGTAILEAAPLTLARAYRFLGPLSMAAFLGGTVQPLIYMALVRHSDQAGSIAALTVATTVSGVLVAPAWALNQLALVIGRVPGRWPHVLILSGWVCALLTVMLFVVGYTSPGAQVVRQIFAVSAAAWLSSRSALQVLILLVPATVALQLVTARQLLTGITGWIFIFSKGLAVAAAGIVVFALAGPLGPAAGALALVLAPGAEALVIGVGAGYRHRNLP